jgi:hypothetical protein
VETKGRVPRWSQEGWLDQSCHMAGSTAGLGLGQVARSSLSLGDGGIGTERVEAKFCQWNCFLLKSLALKTCEREEVQARG